MSDIAKKIEQLKKEKDAVILAHYYVDGEVQDIADYVGDSYYLSEKAVDAPQKVILFCGVSFMGESAKTLSPDKLVLMPDPTAGCPMAYMADIEKIKEIKASYDDLAVVCYINSTANLKQYADVCVTSSNAIKIVKSLPNKNILFIPDENLGRYIASKVPEKNFIFNDGYCPIHKEMTAADVKKAKEQWPDAEVLAHPECTMEVLELADYVGSTSGIINYATESPNNEFIICTETGVFYQMKKRNPGKLFHPVREKQICEDMKKVTLEKVLYTLEDLSNAVELDEDLRRKSKQSLERMLELSK